MIQHIHLELLLDGKAEPTHLQTLGAALNLGFGLASLKRDVQFLQEVQSGMLVLTAAAGNTPPALPENDVHCFLALHRKIEAMARMTPRATLVSAMNYVERAKRAGRVDIRSIG